MKHQYTSGDPGPYDPCPCGEGKKARQHCRTSDGWKREPFTPTLRDNKNATVGCYASILGGCDGGLSDEHAVSAAILRAINADGVAVSGLHWTGPGFKTVPVKRLGTKMLCRAHNTDLTGFDSRIARIFEAIYGHFYSDAPFAKKLLVAGEDVERWLLKVLIGTLCSGTVVKEGKPVKDWHPPSDWLEVLFCARAMPAGRGLYFFDRSKIATQSPVPIQVSLSRRGDGVFTGLALGFGGIGLHLSMEPGGKMPDDAVYKPERLVFDDGGGFVHFSWMVPPLVRRKVHLELRPLSRLQAAYSPPNIRKEGLNDAGQSE